MSGFDYDLGRHDERISLGFKGDARDNAGIVAWVERMRLSEELVQMLRKLEWSTPSTEWSEFTSCPVCMAERREGNVHADDCELDALLRKSCAR